MANPASFAGLARWLVAQQGRLRSSCFFVAAINGCAILAPLFNQDNQMNNTAKLAKIDALLSGLPTFQCKEGCTDCCGPVELSRLEYMRCIQASGRTAEGVKLQMQNNLKQGYTPAPCSTPKPSDVPSMRCGRPSAACSAWSRINSYARMATPPKAPLC